MMTGNFIMNRIFTLNMNRPICKLIIFLAVTTVISSCQEVFEPRIKVDTYYMVVDGMITNNYGPHYIKIFYTKPLGDPYSYNVVSNATVSIVDNQGNVISLEEYTMGTYETPSGFKGEVGVEYTLDIITDDGAHFQSTPQMMPLPVILDSLYASRGFEPLYYVSEQSGRLEKVDMDVLNVFAATSSSDGSFPKFRFTSEAYLQYIQRSSELSGTGEVTADTTYYCWLKRNIIDFVGFDIGEYTIPYEARNHRVAMLPRGVNPMRFMDFPEGLYTDVRVVYNRFLSLNDDAYEFHRMKNEQIRGQGGLFDPVITQIDGNVKCISDPSVRVLGFFEASNDLGMFVYKILHPKNLDNYEIRLIEYFDPLPRSGCTKTIPPDFWM
jgi:hypothetical protein